jgi:hypothetical protein
MLDAEGTISGSAHRRKDDGRVRTHINMSITNSDLRILDEAQRIWPTSRQNHNLHTRGHLGVRQTYRWIPHNVDHKSVLMRLLIPYLIGKRKQAILAFHFYQYSAVAKREGRTRHGTVLTERRLWIISALSQLNHGIDLVLPEWASDPT